MSSKHLVLAGRINQNLQDIERIVQRAERLMKQALLSGDDGYWDGVALNLHGFYAGAERIFEDISRTLDEELPQGANWHQKLLLQMSAALPRLRPAVILVTTRDCLDEYRSFRHIVRNVYTFNLKPRRLQELTTDLRSCYETLCSDLTQFSTFLETIEDEG